MQQQLVWLKEGERPQARGVFGSRYFIFGRPAVFAVDASLEQRVLIPAHDIPPDVAREAAAAALRVIERYQARHARQSLRVLP